MVSQHSGFTTRVWNQFLQSSVSQDMIRCLAQKASNIVMLLDRGPKVITASQEMDDKIPPLEAFISSVVKKSNIQVPTLMTTLLYLSRLRSKLTPRTKGCRSTPHRIFLACLILSEKFLDDCNLNNGSWAACSRFGEFSLSNQEINFMEKQLLFLLDWNLNFKLSELEHHLEPFLILIRDSTLRIRSIRGSRRDLKHRKLQGEFQLWNTNRKTSRAILECKAKQSNSKKRLILPSPILHANGSGLSGAVKPG